MKIIAFVSSLVLLSVSLVFAEDKDRASRLRAPDGWGGERIALPPGFARDMKLKGIEEIRFAPGMFKAKSDSFFSYVFVFQVDAEPKLTKEVLHREILTYYRGLATSVLKGSNVDVDADGFTLKLEASKAGEDAKRPKGLTSFAATLKWLEPFATRDRQTLFIDLEAWQDAQSQMNYLFVIASPKKRTEPIWEEMKKIRASFHQSE